MKLTPSELPELRARERDVRRELAEIMRKIALLRRRASDARYRERNHKQIRAKQIARQIIAGLSCGREAVS